MAITGLRLKNFKCFADSGDIRLAPLTLIFGRNNTGKSTILQSLLLLRQTIDSPGYGPRLNLRGPLYPAGSYTDIVHQHRSKRNIIMKFTVELLQRPVMGDLEMEFRSDEPQPPRMTRLSVTSPGSELVEIRRGRGAGGPYELLIGTERLGRERKANFRFPVNRFLPLIGFELPSTKRAGRRRELARIRARRLINDLEDALRDLRAVGAFRQQPLRRYEYQGLLPQIIDPAGENVVSALIEDISRRRNRGELLRSVNRWLKEIGRVRLLPLRRISKAARIFELRLRDTDSGRWANFADVGFGIGQAFPVLVEGLRTPPSGTFLMQEPEIHLHPDAQLAMADFLVDMVLRGRRVIAETHSEYLLLRVRQLLVKRGDRGRGAHGLDPSKVSLLYVDKMQDGTSNIRRLEVDELGQIRNWPPGFMEEATRERLAMMKDMAVRAKALK